MKTENCILFLEYSQRLYILCGLDIVPMSVFFGFHLGACHCANNVYYEVMVDACVYLCK